jgi:hypothetical protein
MNRYLPGLRPGFLVGCICLVVVWPHSLPAQAPKKAFSDAIIRFLRKQVRPLDEKIANRTEKSVSPEAMRAMKANEAIKKIEAHPEMKDETRILWDIADDATKKRAQMEALELKRELKEEAGRIAEEEKLSAECEEKVASALKNTLCFCVKEKLSKGSWPPDETSTKFVTEVYGATTECVFLGFGHRMSRGVKAAHAKVLVPAMKSVGKALGSAGSEPQTSKSKSSDETHEGTLFGLVYLLCKDE